MIRLTGGEFNGRALATPATLKTRPSQAKLRQALLNSLQMRVPGSAVLDLFAGSGALGFEALSRGAESAVFVENHKAAIQCIEQNCETLKVKSRAIILKESVEGFWKHLHGKTFDIVFCDPPYSEGWEMKLLQSVPWETVLNPGGVFCMEWGLHKSTFKKNGSELPKEVGCLIQIRERTYGDSVLTHYERV